MFERCIETEADLSDTLNWIKVFSGIKLTILNPTLFVYFQLKLIRPDGTVANDHDNPIPDDESDFRREPKPLFTRLPEDRNYDRKLDLYADQGITVNMEAEDLQGENRVVAEGILSEEECQKLIDVATVSTNSVHAYFEVPLMFYCSNLEPFKGLKAISMSVKYI